MSRWIACGLRTGTRTTRFPRPAGVGDDGAPSSITCRWPGLTPADALAAAALCPTAALTATGTEAAGTLRFDQGACVLCGRCVRAFPQVFAVDPDPRVAVRDRGHLTLELGWEPGRPPAPRPLTRAADAVRRHGHRLFRHSLHIRHVDAGSCNGCESELQALNNPYYNLHRFGIFFTASPRFADLLLVTGPVTYAMRGPLLETFTAMPEPRFVLAAGTCAVSGGTNGGGYACGNGLDGLLPVDLYLPGCPPNPPALIHALLMLLQRMPQRVRGGRLTPGQAEAGDPHA